MGSPFERRPSGADKFFAYLLGFLVASWLIDAMAHGWDEGHAAGLGEGYANGLSDAPTVQPSDPSPSEG